MLGYLLLIIVFIHAICLTSLPCPYMIYTCFYSYLDTCYTLLLCIAYLLLNIWLTLVPWCANTTAEYYKEPIGEEISNDLQPAEKEREWCVDDIE